MELMACVIKRVVSPFRGRGRKVKCYTLENGSTVSQHTMLHVYEYEISHYV
jgi:hypothetical protein